MRLGDVGLDRSPAGLHPDLWAALGDVAEHDPIGHLRTVLVHQPIKDPLDRVALLAWRIQSAPSMASITGLKGSSSDARGAIFFRGRGHADSKALRTVGCETPCLRITARIDRPARTSRRSAAYSSVLDCRDIQRPSRWVTHQTLPQRPNATPAEIAFARLWRDMPKVVFSSTIDKVDWNTRLVTGDAVAEIARLKAEDGARWTSAARRSPGRPCGPG